MWCFALAIAHSIEASLSLSYDLAFYDRSIVLLIPEIVNLAYCISICCLISTTTPPIPQNSISVPSLPSNSFPLPTPDPFSNTSSLRHIFHLDRPFSHINMRSRGFPHG